MWHSAQRIGAAVALSILTVSLSICRAAARQDPPLQPAPLLGESPALAREWEDLVLLDALRYLRFTGAQLDQALPLARSANERMDRFYADSATTLQRLKDSLRESREALVNGDTAAGAKTAQAAALLRTLGGRRTAAEDQIAQRTASRLAQILTRAQIHQAYLLSFGQTPAGVAPDRLLTDAGSGFVLAAPEQDAWRTSAISQVLARRYPAELVQAAADFRLYAVANSSLEADLLVIPTGHEGEPSQQELTQRREAVEQVAEVLKRYPVETRHALSRDRRELLERWKGLPALLLEGATDQELALALEPLVRRLFLSRRLEPVLKERIQANRRSAP